MKLTFEEAGISYHSSSWYLFLFKKTIDNLTYCLSGQKGVCEWWVCWERPLWRRISEMKWNLLPKITLWSELHNFDHKLWCLFLHQPDQEIWRTFSDSKRQKLKNSKKFGAITHYHHNLFLNELFFVVFMEWTIFLQPLF